MELRTKSWLLITTAETIEFYMFILYPVSVLSLPMISKRFLNFLLDSLDYPHRLAFISSANRECFIASSPICIIIFLFLYPNVLARTSITMLKKMEKLPSLHCSTSQVWSIQSFIISTMLAIGVLWKFHSIPSLFSVFISVKYCQMIYLNQLIWSCDISYLVC